VQAIELAVQLIISGGVATLMRYSGVCIYELLKVLLRIDFGFTVPEKLAEWNAGIFSAAGNIDFLA
jgi:hypothetical protein